MGKLDLMYGPGVAMYPLCACPIKFYLDVLPNNNTRPS